MVVVIAFEYDTSYCMTSILVSLSLSLSLSLSFSLLYVSKHLIE
jgi:hypothetical protein